MGGFLAVMVGSRGGVLLCAVERTTCDVVVVAYLALLVLMRVVARCVGTTSERVRVAGDGGAVVGMVAGLADVSSCDACACADGVDGGTGARSVLARRALAVVVG